MQTAILKVLQISVKTGEASFRNLYKEERILIQALREGGRVFRVRDQIRTVWHVKDVNGSYIGLFKDSSINCAPHIQPVERRGEEYRLSTQDEVSQHMAMYGLKA